MVRVTWRDLIEFITFLGYPVEMDPGCVQILALQACKVTAAGADALDIETVPNTPDVYNDYLIVVGKNETGTPFVSAFLGTVDPGAYYTREEPNPSGAAHLTFGVHAYVLGEHHGHEALRAKNEINRIVRDRDGDYRLDLDEQVYVGSFGTNVHAGGKSSYIGKWSAGCLNVAGGWDGPWATFLAHAKMHLKRKGSVNVVIWSAADLVGWKRSPATFLPTVVLGVQGPWAAKVQEALRKHGDTALIVDGDWRGETSKKVAAFQASKGLTADGVVGPKTWSYLLG